MSSGKCTLNDVAPFLDEDRGNVFALRECCDWLVI